MNRAMAAALLPVATLAPFSGQPPGAALPPGWRVAGMPRIAPPEFTLVAEAGRTVLRVHAKAAAGSLVHALDADPRETPILAWRWKVDRVLDKARLGTREGDDFAARVYVSFDVPLRSLSLAEGAMVRLARLFHGDSVPTAAICYVWDNTHPVGTSSWNPYAKGRVRMVVVESGISRAREWTDESRDVDADFRAAFGETWTGPVPRITGVAVAADTDQTGETVTAWFGDVRLEARR